MSVVTGYILVFIDSFTSHIDVASMYVLFSPVP